jgi:hypothetical protein
MKLGTIVMVCAMLAAVSMGCSSSNACATQCAILVDCGAVDSDAMDLCTETCEDMMNGTCTGGCSNAGAGDPERCAEALVANNGEADGESCTAAFTSAWCNTYYTNPACSPISVGGITCE